jgi:hypothetical protein
MRFLVRLANRDHFIPANGRQLSRLAYEAVKNLGADIGNLRVGSSAVEFDVLVNSEDKLNASLKVLEQRIGPLLTVRKLDVPALPIANTEAIKLGIDLFNEERYWESHEALESAWKNATGDEKEVLQGLILLAAALVHWQKNEEQVALSVMRRARQKLASHLKTWFGIDIAQLTDKIEKILLANKPEFFKLEVEKQAP